MKNMLALLALGIWITGNAYGGDIPVSESTESCLECHATTHPGIVAEWKKSRHGRATPSAALSVKGLGRKVSGDTVPQELLDTAVGCAECHMLRPERHKDTFEHNGYDIHVVVSPRDCAVCHKEEETQFSRGLMSHAYGNLKENKVYHLLEKSINAGQVVSEGKLTTTESDPLTDAESCYSCHGTRLAVTGKTTRETDFGDMDFPVIEGWPSQGVGRINLDGSRGACSACHTRHRFSIETARKPHTCKQCHVGPDVPAFKVYSASKHGNQYASHHSEWNFNAVPWTVGRDFTAPTCAACHSSLLVNADGEVIVERTHQMNTRLPYRIFGLVYAHSHPKSGDTARIRNKDNLQLPTDFEGEPAKAFLKNPEERASAKAEIQKACLSCHASSWVEGHWKRFENTIVRTNAATGTATRLIREAWRRGYARGPDKGGNPFDEHPEKIWCNNWLFFANTIRFASAMGCGGDFGVFAEGRYHLSANIRRLHDWLETRKKLEK